MAGGSDDHDPATVAALRDMAAAIKALIREREQMAVRSSQRSTAWVFAAVAAAAAVAALVIDVLKGH
jgi:hypothetical protein